MVVFIINLQFLKKNPGSIYTINIADKRQDDKLSPYERTLFHT